VKQIGGIKKVFYYVSIAEAMNIMPYFKPTFKNCSGFLGEENPNFPGSFKAKYWMKEWQDIVFGNNK
jgi:cysteinyl-tRNA synthetase